MVTVEVEGGAELSAWMKAVMAKWTRWDRAVGTELVSPGDGP